MHITEIKQREEALVKKKTYASSEKHWKKRIGNVFIINREKTILVIS